MFIDLPFYVFAVKMRLKKKKKRKKKLVCDIWQTLEVAPSEFRVFMYLWRQALAPGEGAGFKMPLLWGCSCNPLPGQPEKPSAKSGSRGCQCKTLSAALSSVCSMGHPRTPLSSFLWLLCLLYLEELLLHEIWSPDCPGRALRFSQNAFTKWRVRTLATQICSGRCLFPL